MATYPVQNETLPAGACSLVTNLQDLLNLFSQNQNVTVPDSTSSLIISSTHPTVEQQNFAWLKVDSSGRPLRLYRFAQGYWLSPYPLPEGAIIMTDVGQTPVIIGTKTYCDFDGGDTGTGPTMYAGPFYEIVYGGRFPLGVGNTPTVAPPIGTDLFGGNTTISVGRTGGEERHLLSEPEVPPLQLYPDPFSGTPFAVGNYIGGGGLNLNQIVPFPTQTDVGGGETHNNMPPYVGLYILRRTSRLYWAEV